MRGDYITNIDRNRAKVKLQRLVRMHASEMVDCEGVGAGEIVAMFGVECHSGDTFTDGKVQLAMSSMFVADPVISYAIKPTSTATLQQFGKALNRFTKARGAWRAAVRECAMTRACFWSCGRRRTPRSGRTWTRTPARRSSPAWGSCTWRSMWSA